MTWLRKRIAAVLARKTRTLRAMAVIVGALFVVKCVSSLKRRRGTEISTFLWNLASTTRRRW